MLQRLPPRATVLFIVLAACSLAGSGSEGAGPSPASRRFRAIESALVRQQRALHMPGFALGIVERGEVVYLRGFGYRDLERRRPVTPDTLFPLASCTKAFTALAAVMAEDEGKLSLEASPREYLPGFHLRDPEADRRVTVRDLLCHRSGLMAFTDMATELRDKVLTRRDVVRLVGAMVPTAPLRQRFQYNNQGYVVAGEAVAAAERLPYEQLLERKVFRPLGMLRTNCSVAALRRSPDFSYGYRYQPDTRNSLRLHLFDTAHLAPATGVNSSARDMTRWLRFLLGDGRWSGRRLLPSRRMRELFTPQISMGGDLRYCLGWSRRPWRGLGTMVHGGQFNGYNSLVGLMPDRKLGFVLLTNSDDWPYFDETLETMWSALCDDVPLSLTSRQSAAPDPPTPPQTETSLPSVDEVMRRATDAAGGEPALLRHRSQIARATVSYENQGVTADLTLWKEAPYRRSVRFRFHAAGKVLGALHDFVDGNRGGTETTFSAPVRKTPAALEAGRAEADFHDLLHWQTLWPRCVVRGRARVGEEEALVLEKRSPSGQVTTDYLSSGSYRLLRRDSGEESEEYRDYREVDGVWLPFEIRSVGKLGTIRYRFREQRFDVAPPAGEFTGRNASVPGHTGHRSGAPGHPAGRAGSTSRTAGRASVPGGPPSEPGSDP